MNEISDWRRATNGDWFRSASDGADAATVYRLDGQWHASGLRGVLLGCPDAAREAADAHLVSQGRLDKARAFVRLGEWEERKEAFGIYPRTMWFRMSDHDRFCAEDDTERLGIDGGLVEAGRPSDRGADPIAAYVDRWEIGGNRQALATDIDDAREKADVWLVARGELEAGRAFKRVGDWCEAPDGSMWRQGSPSAGRCLTDAGKAAADAELVRRGLLAEERAFKVAKPLTFKGVAEELRTWTVGPSAPGVAEVSHDDGVTWEPAQSGVTLGPKSRLRYKASAEPSVTVAKSAVGVAVGYDATNGRDVSATAVVSRAADGTLTLEDVTFHPLAVGPTVRLNRPAYAEVTLATWEHHLPALLDGAPREFRDGFNRRQGPAWKAYLVALAGVKEQIQKRTLVRPATVEYVARVATCRAHGYLGPEWVKANVR